MLLLFIVVLTLKFFVTNIVKEKFNIQADPLADLPVNQTHKWVNKLVFASMILFILLAIVVNELFIFGSVLAIMISNGIDIAVRYKFEKEEKQYILTIVDTIFFIILLVGITVLYFNNYY